MKGKKIFYGVLAIGPVVMLILSFVSFFGAMLGTMTMSGERPELATGMVFGFIGINMLVMFLGFMGLLVAMVSYCLHILRNKRIPDDHRMMWILGVIVTGSLGQLVYFVVYVLTEAKSENFPNLKKRNPWD